jgi:hypothetical protein
LDWKVYIVDIKKETLDLCCGSLDRGDGYGSRGNGNAYDEGDGWGNGNGSDFGWYNGEGYGDGRGYRLHWLQEQLWRW